MPTCCRFLDACRFQCLPWADALAQGVPAGPCAWRPMTDSWMSQTVVDGVALIGDAAGWSNPVIGQGLAIALRDARVLTDLLLAEAIWSPATLQPYVEERAERMARLRFSVMVDDLLHGFGPEAARRRVQIRALTQADRTLAIAGAAPLVGPWRVPAAGFTEDVYRTLAAA